jgi:hypothetical protein
VLGNKHELSLLGAGVAQVSPTMECALVALAWNKPDGIGYQATI